MTATKRDAFVHRWIENILDGIGATLDENTKIRLMESCGRACAQKEAIHAARSCSGDLEKFLSILGKWIGRNNVLRQGETLHLTYDKCFCPLASTIPESTAKIFCYCSIGWLKAMFEVLLKHEVVVDQKSTILQGGRQCQFTIHLHPPG